MSGVMEPVEGGQLCRGMLRGKAPAHTAWMAQTVQPKGLWTMAVVPHLTSMRLSGNVASSGTLLMARHLPK